MQIKTQRLILIELSLDYLEAIHALHSLPETDEFNTLGIPDSVQSTRLLLEEWIKQQHTVPRMSYIFCVTLIGANEFVGLIALKLGKPNYRNAEVWYKTLPAFWRQGYTTEALSKLLAFGFADLNLHRIEAGCAVENTASIRVLEKVGMIREGSSRKLLPIRGEWKDNYVYAILETEFEKLKPVTG